MFLKIDDAVYVNLNSVFHISWKSYENKGLWIFHAREGEHHSQNPAAPPWLQVQSRVFPSREEGEIWLKRVLETADMLLHNPEGYDITRRERQNF